MNDFLYDIWSEIESFCGAPGLKQMIYQMMLRHKEPNSFYCIQMQTNISYFLKRCVASTYKSKG